MDLEVCFTGWLFESRLWSFDTCPGTHKRCQKKRGQSLTLISMCNVSLECLWYLPSYLKAINSLRAFILRM